MKYNVVNTKNVHSTQRFDPSFHLSDAITLREKVENVPFEKVSIADATENVFLGNIFSRIFVKDAEHGIPYLAASDTVLANLDTGRYLSKKQASILSYLMLKKDWIVVTCSGTIGNVTYTNSSFENHIATHDLIRIVPNDEKNLRGYLYAFLASKYGYNQLTQSQFGGVVKHINADHVRNIKVPCFAEFFQEEVNDLVQEAARLRENASDALEYTRSTGGSGSRGGSSFDDFFGGSSYGTERHRGVSPDAGRVASTFGSGASRAKKPSSKVSPTVERKVDRASASQDFAAGDTVSHKTFGTGTVISVVGDMIEVQFEKTGQTKKLMKGFAPIVKLS